MNKKRAQKKRKRSIRVTEKRNTLRLKKKGWAAKRKQEQHKAHLKRKAKGGME